MKTLNYVECVVLFVSGLAAIVLSVMKTPIGFWLPALGIQTTLLGYAIMRKDGAHWPSTLFGATAAAHVITVTVLLAKTGVSIGGSAQLFFGLFFIHGLLYLVAAKPFLIRRGWLKPKQTQ